MEKEYLKPLINDLRKLTFDYIKKFCSTNSIPHHQVSGLMDKSVETSPGDHGFKIGAVEIKNPIISAPLAGISDNTYRIFASSFGCGLTFSEMVTGYGIHFSHKKSRKLTEITEYEKPCALQLFGYEPDIMAEAAKAVEENADIIDLNIGCPVPKIIKAKSGGYLMQEESRVGEIISSMVSVLDKPLTVKTRTGWNKDNLNVLNIAKIAEDCGASAITIHGRTVKQGFSGEVDYGIIRKVKKEINIPVIASGDIRSPQEAQRVLEYTNCDGAMIGRASKGTLWLFLDILIYLTLVEDNRWTDIKDFDFSPTDEWKKSFARLYLRFLVMFKGEYIAVREFRKHLSWIFKGVRDITKARKRFFLIQSTDDALGIIDSI